VDFTITIFKQLITTLISYGFTFQPFADYLKAPKDKTIILRHDVDRLPQNALHLAQIESSMGVAGTYYFRALTKSFNADIIREIDVIGHEIGYHYENLSACEGNMNQAFADFKSNLTRLRKLATVVTICMHGSPRSRWDSRDLWTSYDYRKFGIIGEPYLDLDFNQVFYITDTGRRWDGQKVSVRDKMSPTQLEKWVKQGLVFRSTTDIVRAAEEERLPERIMITVHPQRWHSKPWPWFKELILQNIKNTAKRCLMNTRAHIYS
jgi:hypothetical protein